MRTLKKRVGHRARASERFWFSMQVSSMKGLEGLPERAPLTLQLTRGRKISTTGEVMYESGLMTWDVRLETTCTLYASKKVRRDFLLILRNGGGPHAANKSARLERRLIEPSRRSRFACL